MSSKKSFTTSTPRARGGGVDALEGNDVDPGLALLPIIAILCGVAVGLGTVALGVVLLVRGRTHEEDSEGIDSRRTAGKACLHVRFCCDFET